MSNIAILRSAASRPKNDPILLATGGGKGSIDLESGWSKLWGAVQGAVGAVTNLMTAVGVIIVVGAVVKYLWERRRGGGGASGGGPLFWSLIVGAALAAPDIIIPLLLMMCDFVANAFVGVFTSG
jgi:hypothetical protein